MPLAKIKITPRWGYDAKALHQEIAVP